MLLYAQILLAKVCNNQCILEAILRNCKRLEIDKLLAEFLKFVVLLQARQTPGKTDRVVHEMITGDSKPPKAAPYRIPVAFLDQIREELKKMLQIGIIERSSSSWSSPLVMVK